MNYRELESLVYDDWFRWRASLYVEPVFLGICVIVAIVLIALPNCPM